MTTAISSDIYAEHAAIETGSGYRMTYNFGNMPSADISSPVTREER